MKFYLVVSTAPSEKIARKLAHSLVRQHLAACVNVIPGAVSFFWWQGKLDKARETLLLIKTSKSFFPRLVKFLQKQHPYQVPEIIAVPIEKGNLEYLGWLEATLTRTNKKR